jgi:hypothetical protein
MPLVQRLRSSRPHVQLDIHTGDPGTGVLLEYVPDWQATSRCRFGSKTFDHPDDSGLLPGELLSRDQLPGGPGDVLGVDAGPGRQ